MNKKIYEQNRLFLIGKKRNIILIVAIFCYCVYLFLRNIKGNIYELYSEFTNFLTFSYVIFPMYLFFLISFFSLGNIQNYMIFRFQSKQYWYQRNVWLLALLVTSFILLWVGFIFFLSLFVVDFTPEWSPFFLEQNNYCANFLLNISPITYTIGNLMLLWLALFWFGLVFYIIFILTKNNFVSIFIVLIVVLINIAITLGKIKPFMQYSFTTYINPLAYILNKQLNHIHHFPIWIFIYWLLCIFCSYLIGSFITKKVDFNFERGEKDDFL